MKYHFLQFVTLVIKSNIIPIGKATHIHFYIDFGQQKKPKKNLTSKKVQLWLLRLFIYDNGHRVNGCH